MKKIILIFILLCNYLFSQTVTNIIVQDIKYSKAPQYGKVFGEIIGVELANLGYTILNRKSDIDNILKAEEIRAKNEGIDVNSGRRTSANYTITGTIYDVSDITAEKYIVTIEMNNLENGTLFKGVDLEVNSLDIKTFKEISKKLDVAVNGKVYNYNNNNNNNSYNYKTSYNNNNQPQRSRVDLYNGEALFAFGIAFIISGSISMIGLGVGPLRGWNETSSYISSDAARELYLRRNPGTTLYSYVNISYKNRELYNAWKNGEISTKPKDIPMLTPLATDIMFGVSAGITVLGLTLMTISLTVPDYKYVYTDFNFQPTIFNVKGEFEPGFRFAYSF